MKETSKTQAHFPAIMYLVRKDPGRHQGKVVGIVRERMREETAKAEEGGRGGV